MRPAVSIIITSHNYGSYLRRAIDSALEQTIAPQTETIVVDDGSSDDSPAIVASFGDRIVPVLQEIGGQASAFNSGFSRCRGEVVIMLDADDLLMPTAAQSAKAALADARAAKVHWPMRVIDRDGASNGRVHPSGTLPAGDYLDALVRQGPWMCENPPTSGNAWSRRMLEEIFPIPEDPWRLCADAYLLAAAPLLGELRRIDQPQSCYRLHDRNNYWNRPFAEAVRRGVEVYERQCAAASELLSRRSIKHDTAQWLRHSWWHRLRDAASDIISLVAAGESFILADEDLWGTPDALNGRRRLAYPQIDGRYSGPPATDEAAVAAIEQVRPLDPRYMIFGWPAFWYLDHFPELRGYLERQAGCVMSNDRIRAFELRQSKR